MPRSHAEYLIHEPFAEGGMAVVHRGELVGAHGYRRTVALKRLRPQHARDPEFVAMLLDEARLSARLTSPHWVRVQDTVTEGPEVFLVMDYVPGVSLSWLRTAAEQAGVRVPPAVASSLVLQVLAALADAHAATDEAGRPLGIVHRDVSPQNVLVTADGFVRLLDLGVAKAAWRAQSTRTGELKGKPAYMAPEQLLDRPVDARADLFAAAILLWELVEGRRLHAEGSVSAMVERLRAVAAAPVAEGAVLGEFLRRALAWEPEARFDTAAAMAAALEEALPPAPPGAVARWVRAQGGAALVAREAALHGGSAAGAVAPVPAARRVLEGEAGESGPAVETTVRGPPRRRALPAWGLAVGGAVVGAALAALVGLASFGFGGGAGGGAAVSGAAPGVSAGWSGAAGDGAAGALADRGSAAAVGGAARPGDDQRVVGTAQPAAAAQSAAARGAATAESATAESATAESATAESATAERAGPGGGATRTAAGSTTTVRATAESGGPGAAAPSAPARTAPRPARTRVAPQCQPPWVIESDGVRRWKQECL